jgi:serine/threonine protein kinase
MIVNQNAIVHALANYGFDISTFEREEDPNVCERLNLYRRPSDHSEIVTKEFSFLRSDTSNALFESLEMLTHLNHRCIVPLFGIVLPTDSTNLTIATLYCQNDSLKEVLANPPSWWTPTAKSKTIAGIVHGMRFAHSLGCVHGSLKPSNILFDKDQQVQIVDFCSSRLRECASNDGDVNGRCNSSDEEETLMTDVASFSSILFEILVGRSVVQHVSQCDEVAIPSFIPSFVRELMESGWSVDPAKRPSFDNIYETLKANDFDVVEGNEVDEVWMYVDFLENCQS